MGIVDRLIDISHESSLDIIETNALRVIAEEVQMLQVALTLPGGHGEVPSDVLTKAVEEFQAQLAAHWLTGFKEALKQYAWWKDGVQYVGTCGTTLKEALKQAGE